MLFEMTCVAINYVHTYPDSLQLSSTEISTRLSFLLIFSYCLLRILALDVPSQRL